MTLKLGEVYYSEMIVGGDLPIAIVHDGAGNELFEIEGQQAFKIAKHLVSAVIFYEALSTEFRERRAEKEVAGQ